MTAADPDSYLEGGPHQVITLDDVSRIASALPGAIVHPDGHSFAALRGGKQKGFAWVWMQRVDPKKPKVPCTDVLAVRVAGEAEKQMLLAAAPSKFFTEAHYNGFPAILVRLEKVDEDEFIELLTDAWGCVVPARVRNAYVANKLKVDAEDAP